MDKLFIDIELVNLLIFTLFIYEHKGKAGMKPLIDLRAIQLLKATYLLPIIAFGWSLSVPAPVTAFDWFCLLLAIGGTTLVVKGKLDLGQNHTWAGYYLPNGKIVRNGIYRWLPHPMYTGIFMVILSCSAVYIVRLHWAISAVALVCCAYVVVFLSIVAMREQRLFITPHGRGTPRAV